MGRLEDIQGSEGVVRQTRGCGVCRWISARPELGELLTEYVDRSNRGDLIPSLVALHRSLAKEDQFPYSRPKLWEHLRECLGRDINRYHG
jgi:hypothetical protein